MPYYPPAIAQGTPIGTAGLMSNTPAGCTAGYSLTGYTTQAKVMPSYTANVQTTAFLGGLLDLLQAARLSDLNAIRVAVENSRALTEATAQNVNGLKAELIALGLITN